MICVTDSPLAGLRDRAFAGREKPITIRSIFDSYLESLA